MKIPVVLDLELFQGGVNHYIPWDTTAAGRVLIAGPSGSGKSFLSILMLAKLAKYQPETRLYLLDFKGADEFSFLRDVPGARYFHYLSCVDGLQAAYNEFAARLEGDRNRTPVFIFADEYNSFISYLTAQDKKQAAACQMEFSNILFMGRGMRTGVICAVQRPDSIVLPNGSREQFAFRVGLGANQSREFREMLFGDAREKIPPEFVGDVGIGHALIDGQGLQAIKVPTFDLRAAQQAILSIVS